MFEVVGSFGLVVWFLRVVSRSCFIVLCFGYALIGLWGVAFFEFDIVALMVV